MKKTGKKQNTDKRDTLIVIGLAVLVIAVVVGAVFFFTREERTKAVSAVPEMPFEVPGFTMLEKAPCGDVNDSLYAFCMGTYSGAFVEDGTDEQVQDVLAIVIKNVGNEPVEYGQLTAKYRGKPVEFDFSGLPATGSVLVMEKNRTVYSGSGKITDLSCEQMAMPVDLVFDFENDFRLYPSDGVINIENISGRDFEDDVSVFYKNFEYGLFLGGITYRARFSGGVKAEKYAQSMQSHYFTDRSAILYMSYGQ